MPKGQGLLEEAALEKKVDLWTFVEQAATKRSERAIEWYNDRVERKVPLDKDAAWFHPLKRAKSNKVEGFQSRDEFRESFEDLLMKPCIIACLALREAADLMLSVATLVMKLGSGILSRDLTWNDIQKPLSNAVESFVFHWILDALAVVELVLQLASFLMKTVLSLSESARDKLQACNKTVDEERGEAHVPGEAKTVFDYIPTSLQFGA